MDDLTIIRLSQAIGTNGNPESVPKHVVDYCERAFTYYAKLGRNVIPVEHLPLLCCLANLENRISALPDANRFQRPVKEPIPAPKEYGPPKSNRSQELIGV